MFSLEIDMLLEIELKLDEHAASSCPRPAYLILLNPGNFELLGWDEVMGLPVLPGDNVDPMKCRLVCGELGSAGAHEGKTVYWYRGLPHVWEEAPAPVTV